MWHISIRLIENRWSDGAHADDKHDAECHWSLNDSIWLLSLFFKCPSIARWSSAVSQIRQVWGWHGVDSNWRPIAILISQLKVILVYQNLPPIPLPLPLSPNSTNSTLFSNNNATAPLIWTPSTVTQALKFNIFCSSNIISRISHPRATISAYLFCDMLSDNSCRKMTKLLSECLHSITSIYLPSSIWWSLMLHLSFNLPPS